MLLLQIQLEFFFWQPGNTDKPNFVSFLVFVGTAATAASFTAKIPSFKAFPKQWISKVIQIYGSQSERPKIAIHWFGEY